MSENHARNGTQSVLKYLGGWTRIEQSTLKPSALCDSLRPLSHFPLCAKYSLPRPPQWLPSHFSFCLSLPLWSMFSQRSKTSTVLILIWWLGSTERQPKIAASEWIEKHNSKRLSAQRTQLISKWSINRKKEHRSRHSMSSREWTKSQEKNPNLWFARRYILQTLPPIYLDLLPHQRSQSEVKLLLQPP